MLVVLAAALPPPGHLHAQARTAGSITIAWRDRARGETRYEVRRGAAAVLRLGAGATRVRVTGLRPGRRYRLRVRACRAGVCGRAASITVRTRPAATGAGPSIGGCPVFPADNAWNRDVSQDPVDPNSDAYVRALPGNLHPDFGSGRYGDYGIPITVVPQAQPLVPIRFTAYGDESDPGPYPIPRDARIEGGSDRHVIVVQQGACRLYELFAAAHGAGDGWDADSGARFDLRSNRSRPAGWTSADAAGLPILPGLARADEASAGAIRHALRFTVRRTQNASVAPARHVASNDSSADLPPMGLRFRL
ncbi:MAG: hypothetical protein QOF12_318, partial [Solirubrobacteraceae bacterium]|nr:hypothetical protein [Solirubrobacteraceae bacterium]